MGLAEVSVVGSLLARLLLAVLLGPAREGLPWRPAGELVALSRVARDGEAFAGREFSFEAQLARRVEEWEGYLTPFHPEGFVGLELWSDEALLWDEEQYRAPALVVFVAKDSGLARLAQRLRPHDRIRVTGRVRALFLGRPWIEVTRLLRTRRVVPEGSVLHAISALSLVEQEAFELAAHELDRALQAPLPDLQKGVLRWGRGFLAEGFLACKEALRPEILRQRQREFRRGLMSVPVPERRIARVFSPTAR